MDVFRHCGTMGGMSNSKAFLEGPVMMFPTVFPTINEAWAMEEDFAVPPIPKYD